MKRILLTLLLILNWLFVHAQKDKKLYLYGELGVGFYDEIAGKAALNSVFLRNNIITVNYLNQEANAHNIPDDYQPEWALFRLFGDDGMPQYDMEMWSVLYGKMLFTESPTARFSLKGGFTFGKVIYPYLYVPKTISGFYILGQPSNYSVYYKEEQVRGIVLNPVLELPFSRFWGLTLGFNANINNYKSLYMLELTTIFGKIRAKKIKFSDS